jgi:hypothetical protein
VRHPGQLLDKNRLMAAVWPNTVVEENNLNQSIGALRKALGDKMVILADANSSYDPPKAIEIGRMLEDIGSIHYEEPCPFDNFEAIWSDREGNDRRSDERKA